MLSQTSRGDRGPPRSAHHLARNTANSIRCFLSTPFAVLTFILVTIFFFYLLWRPLTSSSPILLAHGLRIEIPSGESEPHPFAGVLVGREHDLAEVDQWTAISHHHHQRRLPDIADPSKDRTSTAPFSCYGVHAQRGRRSAMEDTYAVYLNHQLHYSSASQRHLMSADTEQGESEVISPWALFGVYDGHGGKVAAEYTAAYLLPMLHSSLLHHGHNGGIVSPLFSPALEAPAEPRNLTSCFQHTFQSLDEEFIEEIARPEQLQDGSTAIVAGVYYHAEDASSHMDTSSSGRRAGGRYELVVANLGDCRAILVKPGLPVVSPVAAQSGALAEPLDVDITAETSHLLLPSPSVLPLSIDHKPHDEAERRYIESHPAGFVTMDRRGPSRVQGVLATSRAIGDMPLKPWVRNVPDVHIVELEDEAWNESVLEDQANVHGAEGRCSFDSPVDSSRCDASAPLSTLGGDLLLLASDGFWDVFTNEEAAIAMTEYLAAHVVSPSIPPAAPSTLPPSSSSASTSSPPIFSALAHHLAREAYLKGSMDNITVMVVQLDCIKRWLRESADGKRIKASAENIA